MQILAGQVQMSLPLYMDVCRSIKTCNVIQVVREHGSQVPLDYCSGSIIGSKRHVKFVRVYGRMPTPIHENNEDDSVSEK